MTKDYGLAIMLCRNGLPFSKSCLRSLQAQTLPLDILIVDNGSSDGTPAWTRAEEYKDHRIHRMTFDGLESVKTLSVAACWNKALSWAWNRGFEEVLVVNNDTEILPETYQILKEYVYSEPDHGMVTCVSRRSREELEYVLITARSNPDFSCYLLTKKAWDRVGGFDEGFVGAYFEDNDYHVRMFRAGVKAVCVSVPFLHHGAGTLTNADREERKRIDSNAVRNRRRFWEKYGAYPGTKGYEKLFEDVRYVNVIGLGHETTDADHPETTDPRAPVSSSVGLSEGSD